MDSTGYQKKPMWQWIAIYAIIGVIVYGVIYYFMANKGGYGAQTTTFPSPLATQTAPTATQTTKPTSYLKDPKGMTLYIFDKDTAGVSNCEAQCLVAWPAYKSTTATPSGLAANMSVITRSDGSKQYAWMGKPLYYYANDAKPGDTTGDGVGGIWHLVSL